MTLRTRLTTAADWTRLIREEDTGRIVATSVALCRDPTLAALLGRPPGLHSRLRPRAHDTILGWGRRPSGRRAERVAMRSGSSLLLVEDGFLRSVTRGAPAASLIFDRQGVYYDASRPSDLEAMIAAGCTADETARARRLVAAWREAGVSKYNALRDVEGPLPGDYILVVDQVAGDLSVTGGGAGPDTFDEMLATALAVSPDVPVVVKTHPDTAGRRRGYFDARRLREIPRVTVIDTPCHPVRLIGNARAVFTATSQMGFEALLHGVPVTCFGQPFYAGWGLTTDRMPAPSRRRPATLEALVAAALIRYPRYVDPETGAETDVESAIARIAAARRQRLSDPPRLHAVGFSRWKRPILRRFCPASEVRFTEDAAAIPAGADIVTWGLRDVSAAPAPTSVRRVEDGFLRSAGLGAALVRPLSWVFDDTGLHYDPRQPSRLETLLSETNFTPELLARARRLRTDIVAAGLSKYALSGPVWSRPPSAHRTVLVPGQVESDAALRFGAGHVRRNADLLRAVRAAEPDAHIVYKTHPDIVAGLRDEGGEAEARSLADTVVTDADPAALLGAIDEVHVMTSLMGFEALLRGVPVTTWGQPFYAGWGLTRDMHPPPRRGRALSLDALTAAALILYPRYVSRRSGEPVSAEAAVAELAQWSRERSAGSAYRLQATRALLRLWATHRPRRNA